MRFTNLKLPPKLAGFVALLVLLLTILLIWSGWRVLEHERLLSEQRREQHVESAADRLASTIFRSLARLEDELSSIARLPKPQREVQLQQLSSQLPPDAVIVSFEAETFESYPADRLSYYPFVNPPAEPGHDFQLVDTFEFREKDYRRAINELRRISITDNSQVRAIALLRMARIYAKANDADQALETLEELVNLGDVPVETVPASLLGKYSKCSLLRELNQKPSQQIRLLLDDLQGGSWKIDRATYLFYDQQLKAWLDSSADQLSGSSPVPLVLASAANQLWSDWQELQQAGTPRRGYSTHRFEDKQTLTLLTGSAEVGIGMIAGADRLTEWLFESLRPIQEELNLAVQLLDDEGSKFLELGLPNAGEGEAVRTPLDTGLPWTLISSISNQTAFDSDLRIRRSLIVSGILLLLVGFIGSVFLTGRAMARELETARLKSDFVAAVSHEFRTPLTSLRQFTELLVTGRLSGESDRQACYQVLQHEAGRLNRLVENLLDFAKMEAGALQYRWEQTDVLRLVESVINEFQQEAAHRGYSVRLTMSEPELTIRADHESLSRAIWNLLDNALKYSPKNKLILVEVRREGDNTLIQVEDHGLGIRTEEQETIFDRFCRGSSSVESGCKGTGLGLPMVQRIVEDHGGSVTVHSVVGQGSTFTIVLPLDS